MTTRTNKRNNHIDPVLYDTYLSLRNTLGAEIVHRRRRKSSASIEIVFHSELCRFLKGRINTLPEAEACGYWVICRRQTRRGRTFWHGMVVFQLFLSPVHPKKRREQQFNTVSFEPVFAQITHKHLHNSLKICTTSHPAPKSLLLKRTSASPKGAGRCFKVLDFY